MYSTFPNAKLEAKFPNYLFHMRYSARDDMIEGNISTQHILYISVTLNIVSNYRLLPYGPQAITWACSGIHRTLTTVKC